MSNGVHAQLTGDQAEAKVRAAFVEGGFFCTSFEKDRGEDFLVELDAYVDPKVAKPEPRVALIQVKGHRAADGDLSEREVARRVLPVPKLQRWAAYPLPAFVVAVELHGKDACFYAASVDRLAIKVAPEGLGLLDRKEVTVVLPHVADLAEAVRAGTEAFYSTNAFNLSTLDAPTVARNHYERLSTHTPALLPTAKVWMKHFRILWKGPWRPSHFWAMLNDLTDRVSLEDGGKQRPLMATFHIYRSLVDERDNNAIAHVAWIEESHPDANQLLEAIDWPRAKHWLRFNFVQPPRLETLPESYAQNESDSSFLHKAEKLWSDLDRLTEQLLASFDKAFRAEAGVLESLDLQYRTLDDHWNANVGHPSPQYRFVDRMLGHYMSTVDSALCWTRGKNDVKEVTRRRWLAQDVELLRGYRGAFVPVKKAVDDG